MNTLVDESILGEDGKVDSYKMRPIIYDATDLVYRVVGDVVGAAWKTGLQLT
ncbi:MAG TPA: hypothetical protein PK071_03670 [Atopobiaceae bacterium]|nr:hypothetical protein [Atopobiaceae bacterium]